MISVEALKKIHDLKERIANCREDGEAIILQKDLVDLMIDSLEDDETLKNSFVSNRDTAR